MTDRSDSHRMERRGRRRTISDEFEPLTSRQDGLGHGGGLLAKSRRCLRAHCLEVILALWGVAVIFSLIAINSGVHNPPPEAQAGMELADLLPTLTGYQTDFLTLFTTNLSAELLLMSFPVGVVAGETAVPVIFGASYARGSFNDHNSLTLLHYPAENTDETVFVFHLAEDMSGVDVLRVPLTLRTSDENMRTSLSESAPPEWITTLPVLEAGDDSVLVNAEKLMVNGFYITGMQEAMLAGLRVGLSQTRAYPRNAALTIDYQLMADPAGDPSNVLPISIRFSVSALPDEPMQPRVSDERVGYFNTVFKDLGDHRASREGRNTDLIDTEVRLINKRRMRGEGSEPLTYHIDPSVPSEWREYIKTGVENWRPAFAAAGLGDAAIRAVLPDDEDWPEDYDAGDIRFNSITWAVDVDQIFALGPSTIDPRTGEILHSGIVFTDGWLRAWSRRFEVLGESPVSSSSSHRSLVDQQGHGSSDRRHEHTHGHSHPHHSHGHDHSHSHLHHAGHPASATNGKTGAVGVADRGEEGANTRSKSRPVFLGGDAVAHGARASLRYHDRSGCQEERLEDVSLSLLPLVRAAGRSPARSLADEDETRGSAPGMATDEILGAGLTDVIMHEVGHTLGLRHNFVGSTVLTLEELQDPSKTSQSGLSSSVMDYLAINLVSSKLKGGQEPHYFSPRIGEYDTWAIQYGYTVIENEEILTQHEDLQAIAAQALPFSTDEDGSDSAGINPFASVFDLGKEPMDFWEDRMELITELWPVLLERSTQQGQRQFTRYGKAAKSLLGQVEVGGQYAAKYIGGFNISKQRRIEDDTPGPVQLVSTDRQRRALTLIHRVLTGDEATGGATFLPAPQDFPNLAISGGGCDGLEQYCYAVVPLDVLNEVSTLRKAILVHLFSVPRVLRIRLHSWSGGDHDGADILTLVELLQSTTDAIWGEGGFMSQRAKLWENWDLMLFWLDILQALGEACSSTLVPGDVAAEATGMLYDIVETGNNVTVSDDAYGLHRATMRKMREWEERGTDGYVLTLLGGIAVAPGGGGQTTVNSRLHRR